MNTSPPRRSLGPDSRPALVWGPSVVAASPRGSTLIELIVVLALVAVLFGIAVPALTAVPETDRGLTVGDSLQLLSATTGHVVRGDSLVAFPDGRTLLRGGHRAE